MERPFVARSLLDITATFDDLLASLSALQSLSGAELQTIEEKTLLRQALAGLVKNFNVERSSIILYQEGEEMGALELDWENGEISAENGANALDIERSLADRALRTGKPQSWTDLHPSPSSEPQPDLPEPQAGPSLINAPIQVEGEMIGVISMAHSEPGVLNEWHRRLLPLYGQFLGRMLTGNRLLNQLEKEVGKRTHQLESLLEETRRMKQHYQTLSLVDELTGLYNRRFFFSESKRALGRALRYGHPLSLLVMDLDHFKRINDTYGHAMGDTVLQGVAKALESQLRESDILARIGGEEFAVVLPETPLAGAAGLAERLRMTVNRLSWKNGGEEVGISVSIGMAAVVPDKKIGDSESLDQEDVLDMLLSQADGAMYTAKNQGGDQAVAASD